MDNFQCHKHLRRNIYKLGKPWRPLHFPPLSSSSWAPQSDHLCFEFYWQTKHWYVNLPDEIPPNIQLIKTSQEPEGVVSNTVDRLAFLNEDSYAREAVDLLIANCNFRAGDIEIDWIISKARLLLRHDQHCQTLLIGLESVRCHLCFESVLVRRVMDQSFEENGSMKPASKSSLELLKRVDFEGKESSSSICVVCQEELGMYKDKEVLCMPCSHMFHGECILPWLQNSHYCPICRFQMPTH